MSNPLPLPPMRHLRVFESAARLGGFSAAAQELHTTQSAVSRTVADLERLLGTALFERLHRGVRLTRAGELYREAVSVFTIIDGLVFTIFDGLRVRRREELAGCREAVGASPAPLRRRAVSPALPRARL